ncbi:MAG: hypothetical protein KBD78_10915 [Oligoflexales bacterium]|nr:hypothetical protein [Oligoflexales bacterium]
MQKFVVLIIVTFLASSLYAESPAQLSDCDIASTVAETSSLNSIDEVAIQFVKNWYSPLSSEAAATAPKKIDASSGNPIFIAFKTPEPLKKNLPSIEVVEEYGFFSCQALAVFRINATSKNETCFVAQIAWSAGTDTSGCRIKIGAGNYQAPIEIFMNY